MGPFLPSQVSPLVAGLAMLVFFILPLCLRWMTINQPNIRMRVVRKELVKAGMSQMDATRQAVEAIYPPASPSPAGDATVVESSSAVTDN